MRVAESRAGARRAMLDCAGRRGLWAVLALIAVWAPVQSQAAARFGYDELGRLRCMQADSGQHTWYTYDQAGNRTQVAIGGGATCPSNGFVASSLKLTPLNPAIAAYDSETLTITASQLGTASNSATVSATSADATCGTAVVASGNITFTSPLDSNQVCRVDYTITATGMPATNGVMLVTIAYNNPPIANNDTMDAPVSTPTTIDPRTNDSDPDSNPLTVTAVTQGATGTTSIAGAGTGVTVTETSTVHDKFTYTISDSHDKTASATIFVNDRAPTPADDGTPVKIVVQAYVQNQPVDVLSNDTDPDGDTLKIVAVNILDGDSSAYPDPTGTFIIVDAGLGACDFIYTVSDGWGKTATATVHIRAEDNPPPP